MGPGHIRRPGGWNPQFQAGNRRVCQRPTIPVIHNFQRIEKAVTHEKQNVEARAHGFDRDGLLRDSALAEAFYPQIHRSAAAITHPDDFEVIELLSKFISPRKIRREEELEQSTLLRSKFARFG